MQERLERIPLKYAWNLCLFIKNTVSTVKQHYKDYCLD